MAQQRGLGKGIGALFADYTDNREVKVEGEGAIQQLDITMLDRNPEQARKTFDEDTLKEMANSMKLYGVLQPLLVTKLPNGRYQIVAGERRYRAAMKANLTTVPAIIKDLPVISSGIFKPISCSTVGAISPRFPPSRSFKPSNPLPYTTTSTGFMVCLVWG